MNGTSRMRPNVIMFGMLTRRSRLPAQSLPEDLVSQKIRSFRGPDRLTVYIVYADTGCEPLHAAGIRRTAPKSLRNTLKEPGMADPKNGLTYADAGVDIDAGNRLVDLIKPMVRATARAGADAEIGGFGGLFDLKAAGFKDPILVAATDGVGTKVMIAI